MKTKIFSIGTLVFGAMMLLTACGGGTSSKGTQAEAKSASESTLLIEKPQLTFGFIKLTDMAPLAIAKELGYFEEEGFV